MNDVEKFYAELDPADRIPEYDDAIARRLDAGHPHNRNREPHPQGLERPEGVPEADLTETHDSTADLLAEYRQAAEDRRMQWEHAG